MENFSNLSQRQQVIIDDFNSHPDKYLPERKANFLKRKKAIIKMYIEYSILITQKKLTPGGVMEIIAKEYNTTRQNINFVLKSAGIYKNRLNPIVIPDNFELEEEGISSPNPQQLRFFLS